MGIALAAALAGCAAHRPEIVSPGTAAPELPAGAAQATAPPAKGRAFEIDSQQSALTVLVFRGGTLAAAGHNHLIAAHQLTGSFSVDAAHPLQTAFEVHMPLEQLTVDEPDLRQALNRDDFPSEVPESARLGTRRNMLGEAVLDASHHPEIVLRAAGMRPGPGPGEVLATVLVNVRGEDHAVLAAVSYDLTGDELRMSGQFPLKQSDLGMTPFSALMGALTVQDEMQVRFDLRAHLAPDPR